MKRLVLFFVLFASPVFAQNHADVVGSVKDALVAQGKDLSGPCGAFQIVKRVAWQLRFEGAGTLFKDGGNNCESRAVDIIAYPDGRIFDVLVDSGGSNVPVWNPGDAVEASRWRAAVDPGGLPPSPSPTPSPAPVPTLDLSGVYARIEWSDANNERRYRDLKAEAEAAARRAADLAAQLKAHDEKSGLLAETFGNRYMQIGLAVLGTIITQQQVTK